MKINQSPLEQSYSELSDSVLAQAIEEIQFLQENGHWGENSEIKSKLIQHIKDVTKVSFSQAMTIHQTLLANESMKRLLTYIKGTGESCAR